MRQFSIRERITVFESLVVVTVIVTKPHGSLLNSYIKYRKTLSDREKTKTKHKVATTMKKKLNLVLIKF